MRLEPKSKLTDSSALYEMRAAICRALGHPVRLAILDLLAEGEVSNADLLAALGVSKVNLSQHLAVMKAAGLVESRQQGRQVIHRLAFTEIRAACQMIRNVLVQRLKQGSAIAEGLARPESS
ncbi:MAG TPA: metalloregulator ArsR/SmtB family transcription factor [Candidatus Acidoferrales bacterium]